MEHGKPPEKKIIITTIISTGCPALWRVKIIFSAFRCSKEKILRTYERTKLQELINSITHRIQRNSTIGLEVGSHLRKFPLTSSYLGILHVHKDSLHNQESICSDIQGHW